MPAAPKTESGHELRQYTAYKKRPYAKACLACKARKIRCVDADDPPCKACRTARIACEFPERPVRPRRSAPPAGSAGGDAEHQALIEKRLRRIEQALALPPLNASHQGDSGSDGDEEMEPPRFTLGGNDSSVYHGETSIMHDDGRSIADPSPKTSISTGGLQPPVPQYDASMWSPATIRGLTRTKHKYVSADEGEALIDAYFCWASLSTAVINRTLFLRDMATNGPYFSELLLLVIYLSGVRFTPNMEQEERQVRSNRFMNIIMGLIAEELSKPSSLATAQALFSLAGTRCAMGDTTQSWLLTGLGIRMIQDMGIHLAIDDPSMDEHLDQETRDVRCRLYWSAYCWDKQISLGMGREPALLIRPGSTPKIGLNDADDDWEWRPVFTHGHNVDLLLRYPRTTSRTSYVLKYTSQLDMIVESILVNMYSPHRPHARSSGFIHSCDERLIQWRKDLPTDLKLIKGNFPEFCPPANITVLNLLYYTMRILLYRPLLTVRNQPSGVTSSSFDMCRACAIDIHEIVSLWGRTYGNINMVYMHMYATFVAAGIDVILLRIGDAQTREEALKRVHLSLAILEQVSGQGPGIRRGITIIASQLEAATQRQINNAPTPVPPDRGYAESSLRGNNGADPAVDPSSLHLSFEYGPSFGQAPGTTSNDMLPPTARPFSYEYTAAAVDSSTLFDDPQALANLLGDSNVGTDDPFAFLSAEGWDDVRL